jgi:1-phosphofructokinase
MIVTVTPNPSVDRTLFVDAWSPGRVMRASGRMVEPSGKGVNVAIALHRHGHDSLAVLPVGGSTGEQLLALLDHVGLAYVPVSIGGEIRTNVTIVEASGQDSKVNESGPELSDAESEALLAATLDAASRGDWLAACGSLPPGVPVDYFARIVSAVRVQGGRVAVDTSGPALVAAIDAGPELVKPNAGELAEVVGAELETFADVVDAAQQVRSRGVAQVLVSLGPDGVIHVGPQGVLHGAVTVDQVESTVGAGDAALAGFLSAGPDPRAAVVAALRWSGAAVATRGTLVSGYLAGPSPTLSDVVPLHRQLNRRPS